MPFTTDGGIYSRIAKCLTPGLRALSTTSFTLLATLAHTLYRSSKLSTILRGWRGAYRKVQFQTGWVPVLLLVFILLILTPPGPAPSYYQCRMKHLRSPIQFRFSQHCFPLRLENDNTQPRYCIHYPLYM